MLIILLGILKPSVGSFLHCICKPCSACLFQKHWKNKTIKQQSQVIISIKRASFWSYKQEKVLGANSRQRILGSWTVKLWTLLSNEEVSYSLLRCPMELWANTSFKGGTYVASCWSFLVSTPLLQGSAMTHCIILSFIGVFSNKSMTWWFITIFNNNDENMHKCFYHKHNLDHVFHLI